MSATKAAYLFGAICPARGTGAALAMPYADSEAIDLHLVATLSRVRRGAPTHCTSSIEPAGVRPVAWSCRRTSPSSSLPSRAPELDPVEKHLGSYLHQNSLSNRVFEDLRSDHESNLIGSA